MQFSRLISLLFLLPLFSVVAAEQETKPSVFYTDGCSMFPDGKLQQQALWQDCCIAHDLQYWAGGSYADRLAADEALESCVADLGEAAIAKLMMVGVRAGGSPFFPTTYRWAYGWPFGRGYQALNEDEKVLLLEIIEHSDAAAFIPQHPIEHWLQQQKADKSEK